MKKVISILLIMCVLILSSCNNKEQSQTPTEPIVMAPSNENQKRGEGVLQLYFSSSDSLNPYKAQTNGNRRLSTLLFDSLTKLDKDLNPVYSLAKSIYIEGRAVTINLKSARFSDGSYVTAEDVTYSISLAKSSKTAGFSDQLDSIYSYSASSSSVVYIVLKKEDPFAAALFDFPIVKKGTTNRENDEGKELPPIGSGRYTYKEDKGIYSLIPNKNFRAKPPKNKIALVHTPDTDALDYNIRVGGIDLYYSDMHSDTVPSMNGQLAMVDQTNLVFLGVNQNYNMLKNSAVRSAISFAINRNALVEGPFSTYAKPAVAPFPSSLQRMKKAKNLLYQVDDEKKVIEHLAKVGYNNKNDSGIYCNKYGTPLEVTLLYNRGNVYHATAASAIDKQLELKGIYCTLVAKDFASYQYDVRHGHYQLYLGEVKLNKNFDLYPLYSKQLTREYTTKKTTAPKSTETESTDSTTIPTTTAKPTKPPIDSGNTYKDYLEGDCDINEFLGDFNKDLPFVPLVYRCGALCYSASIPETALGSVSDVYYNIEQLSSIEEVTKIITTIRKD